MGVIFSVNTCNSYFLGVCQGQAVFDGVSVGVSGEEINWASLKLESLRANSVLPTKA